MKRAEFYLESDYQPMGDQPTAISELVDGVDSGRHSQVLLGVTGSGKTFTMATVIAMARAGGMLRKDGTFKNMGRALTADATATIAGAVLGTSTTGAYVESSAGIEAGGKTGLTAIVTGILFILALFISPLIECVPAAATAPALIIIGILMMRAFKDVDFSDVAVVIPVFICMIMIAFTFKISEGFAFGLIAYVFLFCITGRAKKITVATWFLFAMMCAFICSI